MAEHFWLPKRSPGPVLVAKFGPARTTVGKGGPFLTTKTGPGRPFLAAKIGPEDHFWAKPIFTWQAYCCVCRLVLASFPGPARSLLAVRNSRGMLPSNQSYCSISCCNLYFQELASPRHACEISLYVKGSYLATNQNAAFHVLHFQELVANSAEDMHTTFICMSGSMQHNIIICMGS